MEDNERRHLNPLPEAEAAGFQVACFHYDVGPSVNVLVFGDYAQGHADPRTHCILHIIIFVRHKTKACLRKRGGEQRRRHTVLRLYTQHPHLPKHGYCTSDVGEASPRTTIMADLHEGVLDDLDLHLLKDFPHLVRHRSIIDGAVRGRGGWGKARRRLAFPASNPTKKPATAKHPGDHNSSKRLRPRVRCGSYTSAS